MSVINLLPLQQQPVRVNIKQTQLFIGVGAACGIALLFAVYIFYQIKINDIGNQIAQKQVQQNSQTQEFAYVFQLIKEIKDYQEKIAHIETNKNEGARLKAFLQNLSDIIPEDLYLVNLSWHEHAGIIYGQAMNNNDVIKFMQALKNNAYFKKIELIKSDRRHEQDNTPPIYFVINFYAHD